MFQLGVQIVDEEDELRFGFDLLDPTKIIPEDLVPVTKLGKLQLNRNPRNFFAETEQVMVCLYTSPSQPEPVKVHIYMPYHSINPDTSSAVLILATILSSRVGCSPILTLS